MERLELALDFPYFPEGSDTQYLNPEDLNFQFETFNVKSEKKLSPLTKLILQSVQFKHFYYARDDIYYLLKSNPIERDFLLQALYSIVISLQNNLSINFFDMWIYEIYINKVSAKNKFMNHKLKSREYITIKLAYGSNRSQEKK